jgi:hypothetical protein
VRADVLGQGLHRRRAACQLIGDAEGGCGVQRLRDPERA